VEKSKIIKKISLAAAVLLTSVSSILLYYSHSQKKINTQIARYERRLEQFPEEPENYQMLSRLYDKLGDIESAERYYGQYQKFKKDSENLLLSRINRSAALPGVPPSPQNQNDDSKLIQDRTFPDPNPKLSELPEKNQKKEKNDLSEPSLSPRKPRQNPLDDISDLEKKATDEKEKKAYKAFKDGYQLYQKEEYSQAREKFEEAFSLKNNYSKALSYTGSAYFYEDDYENASYYSKEALKIDPSDDLAWYTIGEVLLKSRNYSSAENHFLKTTEINPDNFLAYYRLASLKFQKKNYIEAANLYKKTIELSPSFYRAFANLGITLIAMQQFQTAKIVFEKALQIPELRKDTDILFTIYFHLGQTCASLKEEENALKYLKLAQQLRNNDKVLFTLGTIYESKNNTAEAAEHYRKAIQLNDSFFEARFNLGNILFNDEKWQEALEEYKKATEINARHISSWVQAGKTYAILEQDDTALLCFNTALRINDKNPTANIEVAKYWRNKGIMDKAVMHAKIALFNEKVEIDKIIYFNELGLIYMRFKLYEDAEKTFNEARDINPSNLITLHNLARLFVISDKMSKAEEIYLTILKISKTNYETYEFLGDVYIKLGKNKEAAAVLEELIQNNPSYPNRAGIENKLTQLKN